MIITLVIINLSIAIICFIFLYSNILVIFLRTISVYSIILYNIIFILVIIKNYINIMYKS